MSKVAVSASSRATARSITCFAILTWAAPTACQPVQPQLGDQWTGGFALNGAWTMVNVRFGAQGQGPAADIIFPYYGGGENAINIPLEALRAVGDSVHFEVPVQLGRVVFDGRRVQDTIVGQYVHPEASGTFGLTRRADVSSETLRQYYGAYGVAPDRVISIIRGWGSPRTLNYVDYSTGRVGTLWPSSETDFYSGTGLAVGFPVTLRVSFDRDSSGTVAGLVWQGENGSSFSAPRLEFTEERVVFSNDEITLEGTLILPASRGQWPVVIVIPGDYGTDRDQLRLWANNFVSAGVGAMIFDARGGGESGGVVNSSSFIDLADDVLAGVQSLRARDDVDPDRIGLFGFSNSAFTASLAASRSEDVGFLVLQSLVGVVPWRQESFRAETQLRVDGFSDSIVHRAGDFMRLKYEVARTGKGWEQLQEIMEQARGERWLGYTNPPNDLERLREVYDAVMTYDPVPALEKLTIPILAVWGGKDTYLPVPESVHRFELAMSKARNEDYLVQVYQAADHSLLETERGSPSTGGTEIAFAEGYWRMQRDWIERHVTRTRGTNRGE